MCNEDRYLVTILANENTKGLALNGNNLSTIQAEHEFLLARNQEFIVLEVDDINKTATVLLI